MLRYRSTFRSPPSRVLHRTLTQMRYRTVAVHHRWYRSRWVPTTLAVESPTDLFVASHWRKRYSCRFPVTLLVFSRAGLSTLQVLTTSQWFLFQRFYWRVASKSLRCLVPRQWRHTPRLKVMHVVFRSLLKIFVYAAKLACKQLECNKAKLLQPASINRLDNLMA